MDDQATTMTDDRLSFITLFNQLIQFSSLEESRKEYFLNLLTEARYSSMSSKDAEELLEIANKTQVELEQKIIDSDDADMINELTDLKEFTYNLLNEAEEKGYRLVLGGQVGEDTANAGTPKSSQWLLDKFAGLAE